MSARQLILVAVTGFLVFLSTVPVAAQAPVDLPGRGAEGIFSTRMSLVESTGARRRIDWTPYLPPIGNQGNQQSCIGWAVGYACRTAIEAQAQHQRPRNVEQIFSPAFLYNQINHHTDKGGQVVDALKLLRARGCATLATMPYDEHNWTRQPSAEAFREAANYRIAAWKALSSAGQIRQAVGQGKVVILVVRIDPVFQAGHFTRFVPGNPAAKASGKVDPRTDANEQLGQETDQVDEELKDYDHRSEPRTNRVHRRADRRSGGTSKHALCVVGYDDDSRSFLLMNSWGKKWGNRGYCWIPYASLHKIADGSSEFGQEAYILFSRRQISQAGDRTGEGTN